MKEKDFKVPLKLRLMGQATALLLPQTLRTIDLRIAHYDRGNDPARPEYNEHAVFTFWHEFIGVILPRWAHTPLSILSSQHRDGEWVGQTAESLGLGVVRGSSTRGGASAIRELKKVRNKTGIAITPDGPRGPRRQMALGPVFLASRLEMPFIPLGVGYNDAWRLNTWDSFGIPKPFSRARVIFGPKIRIPRNAGRDELEAYRVNIEKLMNDLSDHAFSWACSGQRMVGEQPFVRVRRNKVIFERESSQDSESNQDDESRPELRIVKAG